FELHPQPLDGLVHLLEAGVVLVGGLLDHRQRRALVDRERVVLGVRGELAAQGLADLHAGLGQHRLHPVLGRDRGLVAQVAAARQATSKPSTPCGSSSSTSTRSTSALPGPERQNSTSASTASSSPSKIASTVPSPVFRTVPATPRRSASSRVESRKKTPCTRP